MILHQHTRLSRVTLASIIVTSLLVAGVSPAFAATRYMDGSPVFSVAVAGVNEFIPGQETMLTLILKNGGLFRTKQLDKGALEREELPTTAKFVSASLGTPIDSIIVRTDPQMIGTFPGNGETRTLVFQVKIAKNATAREYELPLTVKYQYPKIFPQERADTLQFLYETKEVTLPVAIRVRPVVTIDVLQARAESLSVGTEGFIYLQVRNSGPEKGEKTVISINRHENSPIVPVDTHVFVGDFPCGEVVECSYKVAISSNARNQTYPVDVIVTYRDHEGMDTTTTPTTVGIPVAGKTRFVVTSSTMEVQAGTQTTIEVQYRNEGTFPVYSCQARLTTVNPFQSEDNQAYLGDIGPGETGTARFHIRADKAAEMREYLLESEIRYRDSLGNSQTSDPVPVHVRVPGPGSGIEKVPGGSAGWIAVPIVCILGIAGFFVLSSRRQ